MAALCRCGCIQQEGYASGRLDIWPRGGKCGGRCRQSLFGAGDRGQPEMALRQLQEVGREHSGCASVGGSKGCGQVIPKPPCTTHMLACCQFSHEVLNGLASCMDSLTISYASARLCRVCEKWQLCAVLRGACWCPGVCTFWRCRKMRMQRIVQACGCCKLGSFPRFRL